ncbi:HAD-IIIC family phosphatase, partial [Candidatus Omnitrophota bacterium]
ARMSIGIADSKDSFSEREFYNRLNMELMKRNKDDARVCIFDLDAIAAHYGKARMQDPKYYYLAKMEWTDGMLKNISAELTKYLIALKGSMRKCLVLDLDNTLWGGVVGEDGPMGIKIGVGAPEGEAFLDFQYAIKSLKHRGIILALCSKNNFTDIEEVFSKRTEMPLSLDDFSAIEVNWEHKHLNIQRIAESLNIGIDSMVFVDDNPVECELVKKMLPEVITLQLPEDSSEYRHFLMEQLYFEKIFITKDDKVKGEQYSQQRKRDGLKSEVQDLESFLNSLETEVIIKKPNKGELPRVHQLFSKTNQFNLTTIRYSISEIEEFYGRNDVDLKIVQAKDKFGDMGTIGVYLIIRKNGEAVIDSFIMSCRALGREIETAVMNVIKRSVENLKITAKYVPTKKNKPCEGFFEKQGFDVVGKSEDGVVEYVCKDFQDTIKPTPWIRVVTGD